MADSTIVPFLGLDRIEADLDRELAAVLPQAVRSRPAPIGRDCGSAKKDPRNR